MNDSDEETIRRQKSLTDEELAELRCLEQEATQGLWVQPSNESRYGKTLIAVRGSGEAVMSVTETALYKEQDFAFIIAARNALPRLLDEIADLRERNAELQEALDIVETKLNEESVDSQLYDALQEEHSAALAKIRALECELASYRGGKQPRHSDHKEQHRRTEP